MIKNLKTGDVIYATCIDNILCQHTGIIYENNGIKKVFHASPYIQNKYGGSICSEPYQDFIKGRNILKIVRSNVSNKRILSVARKYKYEVWDSFFFNCEDFITEIVEGEKKSDVRDAYKVAALGVALIALY